LVAGALLQVRLGDTIWTQTSWPLLCFGIGAQYDWGLPGKQFWVQLICVSFSCTGVPFESNVTMLYPITLNSCVVFQQTVPPPFPATLVKEMVGLWQIC